MNGLAAATRPHRRVMFLHAGYEGSSGRPCQAEALRLLLIVTVVCSSSRRRRRFDQLFPPSFQPGNFHREGERSQKLASLREGSKSGPTGNRLGRGVYRSWETLGGCHIYPWSNQGPAMQKFVCPSLQVVCPSPPWTSGPVHKARVFCERATQQVRDPTEELMGQ